jgi:hypothetical protein
MRDVRLSDQSHKVGVIRKRPRSSVRTATLSQKTLCPNIYGGCVDGCAILDRRTLQSPSVSAPSAPAC